ncbi:hemolysin III family protein [Amphritea atlantica]|uniref:Hemolysin III family protein n=1 Tax=Amphritea atlantica TaxID=355243 RepID=A0ABY5GVS9_9GAMM|nr:hemolysin III family protein [Amphritea atlantica]
MYYGEKLNSISHLIGTVLALVGFGALLAISIEHDSVPMTISFIIFGLTLVLLYSVSTLYHSLQQHSIKRLFRKLDHVAIYFLISGTYTPYMLVSLAENNGPLLLSIIWGMAVIGILIDTLNPNRIEALQISIYLVMGWACIFEYSSLQRVIPAAGMFWLTVGGITYTCGIIFYVLDHFNKLPHAHGIWHVFVLSGSISHFISIIGYVR